MIRTLAVENTHSDVRLSIHMHREGTVVAPQPVHLGHHLLSVKHIVRLLSANDDQRVLTFTLGDWLVQLQ